MHPFISSHLSRLLIDRKNGHRARVLTHWREIQSFDYLPDEARARHQHGKLATLLRHAQAHAPAYRELLAKLDISRENARENLSSLPILTKQDLQTRRQELIFDDCDEAHKDATGGSSGQPTVFLTDTSRRRAGEAATYWSNGLAGWRYGERVAMLWGVDEENPDLRRGVGKRGTRNDEENEEKDEGGRLNDEGGREKDEESSWCFILGALLKGHRSTVRVALRKMIENMRWYNAFDMGEEQMRDFHGQMTRFAPHLLVGYAGSLFEYARFLERNKRTPAYPLKSVVSSAEVLTSAMRKVVERVFEKPVFNRYGNREFGPVAAECDAHAGLHINEHDMLVEIDSPDPEHIPGEIIVTYFHNFAQPFIRYNTADRATITYEPCSCGRTTARLKTIEGRTSDTITTAEGRMIHGEYFTHLMYGVEGVRAFQFVQETMDSYVLRVECDEQIADKYADDWSRAIKKKLGSTARVRVETVETIPLLPSGKRKFTLSLIKTVPTNRTNLHEC